jgi:hypothetical protein
LAKTQLRVRRITFLFLMLTMTVIGLSVLPHAKAGMTITSISSVSGNVGTEVVLSSNLTTSGGRYEVRFDSVVLASGNATGNSVNASFIVPETTAGDHNVTVVDITTGDNVSEVFTVSTAYNMSVEVPQAPEQLQEGGFVPIYLNMTGGEPNQIYVANITVLTPANVSYVKMVNISTSTVGSGNATTNYPADFATDANTKFVGDYSMFFNDTIDTKSFFVGLTNSTEYHRAETVNVRVVYAQDENVTLAISGNNVYNAVNLTADSKGIIDYSGWAVPDNASIGTYNVAIVSMSGPTVKNPPDTQNFTVPGFGVNVTARNLAGEAVQSVGVETFENGASLTNETTGSDGMATWMLEIGNYTLQAYYQSVQVGERELEVSGVVSTDIVCNLTNLGIRVVAVAQGVEIAIPEATVYVTPINQTYGTDVNGLATVHSLLPNVTYTLNVSRYGMFFNFTTIPQLLAEGSPVAWSNITFVTPTLRLLVDVMEGDGQPIGGAIVKVRESMGGLYSEGDTSSDGIASFTSAFGRYNVEIYDASGIKLNATTVDLFQDANVTVYCDLYNLSLSVKVVDYLGQPISNVNVVLQREGLGQVIKPTGPDGTATFDNLVGGSFEVTVYLSGQSEPVAATSFLVENTSTTEVQLGNYLVLAGFLVQMAHVAVVVVVVLIVALILVLEIFRRRRSKPQKGEGRKPE